MNRTLTRTGYGLCGCAKPERAHDTGCLWGLDRRASAGDHQLWAAVIDLQLRVTALEDRPVIDLRDGGL